MENTGSLPSSLSFALNQVQGCSTNAFQIASSTGDGSVSANGSIKFNAPTTGIMDFKTSKMYFSVTTTGKGARLPKYIDTLFAGVRITAGGQTIVQNNSLHGLIKCINYETGVEVCDPVTGHPEVLDVQQIDGQTIKATDEKENYGAFLGSISRLFAVDMGEIARISPRLVSLDLCPAIQIEFIVAPDNVLMAVKSTIPRGQANSICAKNDETPTFTIDKPVFIANCYSLLSSSYAMAVRQRIADIGYLTLVYKQTLGFTQNWVGNSNFSLSANSVDKLSSVWRLRTHSDVGGAVPIAGRCVGLNVDQVGGYGYTGAAGVSTFAFDKGDATSTCTEQAAVGERRYQAPCQRLQWPNSLPVFNSAVGTTAAGIFANYGTTTAAADFNWTINSANYPQFNMQPAEVLQQTLRANDIDEMPDCKSMQEFLANKFICAVKLDLPKMKFEKPCVSGLSTTGQNAYFGIRGSSQGQDLNNYENTILAETSVLWRIGANKQMEIIN